MHKYAKGKPPIIKFVMKTMNYLFSLWLQKNNNKILKNPKKYQTDEKCT